MLFGVPVPSPAFALSTPFDPPSDSGGQEFHGSFLLFLQTPLRSMCVNPYRHLPRTHAEQNLTEVEHSGSCLEQVLRFISQPLFRATIPYFQRGL